MWSDAERAAISELIKATLLACASRDEAIRSFGIIHARRAIYLIERGTQPFACSDNEINEFVQAWNDLDPIPWTEEKGPSQ